MDEKIENHNANMQQKRENNSGINENDFNINNLNKTYNNNNSENIELVVNPSANKSNKDDKDVKIVSSKFYKLDRLLDLNLKFDSSELECIYNRSYLAVTRLFFLKYILFLILFLLSWLLYFLLTNSSINNKLQGDIDMYVFVNDKNEINFTRIINDSCLNLLRQDIQHKNLSKNNAYHINNLNYNSNEIASSIVMISYLASILVLFLLIFSFVLMIEISENSYRHLEKEIQKNELEKKVDTKKAERDLKLAMEDIVKKEEENISFKIKLKSKYRNVAKLRSIYSRFAYTISILVVILMFLLSFLPFIFPSYPLSIISHFVWFCMSLLVFYLIYPFHLVITVVFGVILSVLFEVLLIKKQLNSTIRDDITTSPQSSYLYSQIIIFVFIKILLHSSLHLIASYLKLSLQGIKRETFLKVAHIHKSHLTSQHDKEITERMIKSIMPPLFTHVFGKPEEFKKSVNTVHLMRPLFIYPVNEISILFADIVGFTRMSSTKTAEQLVFLLNDLYGRFDKLCEQTFCEKISTLGDCYYCVSGCLNSRKDHANCCVEMGLLMVKEIEQFNKVHNVDVNMRVGVHTGNALCGFIGGKRFRFDVWSGDVTLANKMESSGRAGWVHISEDTFKHLNGKYNTEIGDKYSGKSTYFVIRETKRETVADALKQFASYDAESASSKADNFNENEKINFSENNLKRKESNSFEGEEIELEKNTFNQSSNKKNTENDLLLLAVKNIQFFKPEYNFLTMHFGDKEQEKKYKSYLVGGLASSSNDKTIKSFWTHSQSSSFLSILVSFIINLFVSTSFFLSFIVSSMSYVTYKMTGCYRRSFIMILVIYCLVLLVQTIFLIFCLVKGTHMIDKKASKQKHSENESMLNGGDGYSAANFKKKQKDKKNLKKFFLLHITSIIILSLVPLYIVGTSTAVIPNILINTWPKYFTLESYISQFSSSTNIIEEGAAKRLNLFSVYSFLTYIISLLHFGSFIQTSSLLKTCICLVFTFVYTIVSLIGVFDDKNGLDSTLTMKQFNDVYDVNFKLKSFTLQNSFNVTDNVISELISEFKLTKIIKSSFNFYSYLFVSGFLRENFHIIIDTLLLLLFIWILNRQSELIQRLSFKYDQDAHLRVTYAREQKELANWLIDVVLPLHVVDHVKEKKQYSSNYKCVGVLFVSLCNFWEFFEESYEGGRELLRVLNEITVDFDRLFDDPKYKNVEKIKSIGSTIMIASGLNPEESINESNKHLYDLVDFALELNEKLEAFNNEAMSVCHFKFQMRMGFNCGPVTAGVIGTERLLYDIWGDTVNVASRMDSTGQPGFLQTPIEVAELLKDSYKFFERGVVQIKGKDEMVTYFMNPKENKKTN